MRRRVWRILRFAEDPVSVAAFRSSAFAASVRCLSTPAAATGRKREFAGAETCLSEPSPAERQVTVTLPTESAGNVNGCSGRTTDLEACEAPPQSWPKVPSRLRGSRECSATRRRARLFQSGAGRQPHF